MTYACRTGHPHSSEDSREACDFRQAERDLARRLRSGIPRQVRASDGLRHHPARLEQRGPFTVAVFYESPPLGE